ncbi:MAG: peptide chain release factor-like protein, partial [Christensenellales bacterium]
TLSDNINSLKNELFLLLDNLNANEQNALIEVVLGDGENAKDLKNDIVLGFKNYFEKHDFKYQIFDSTQNTLFEVTGLNVKNIMQTQVGLHLAKLGNKNSSCKVFVYDNLNLDKPTFDEKDLKIQTTRSSGAGGQHINTTDSSIKITHIKTGITSVCQDQRSQFQNKQKALQNLKEKVFDFYDKQKTKNAEKQKREQVKLINQNYVAKIYDYQSKTIGSKINGNQLNMDDFLSGNDL